MHVFETRLGHESLPFKKMGMSVNETKSNVRISYFGDDYCKKIQRKVYFFRRVVPCSIEEISTKTEK